MRDACERTDAEKRQEPAHQYALIQNAVSASEGILEPSESKFKMGFKRFDIYLFEMLLLCTKVSHEASLQLKTQLPVEGKGALAHNGVAKS